MRLDASNRLPETRGASSVHFLMALKGKAKLFQKSILREREEKMHRIDPQGADGGRLDASTCPGSQKSEMCALSSDIHREGGVGSAE